MRSIRLYARFVAVAWLCIGCASAGPSESGREDECDIGPTVEFDASRALALAGDYRLTMRADSTPFAGATTTGRLSLFARSDTRRPLVGTVDVDLAAVAGAASGDPRSSDPAAPGVYFEPRKSPFGYTRLVIGHSPGRNDGKDTRLKPERFSARGFSGRWTPDYGIAQAVRITGEPLHVGGEFCALRVRS